MEYLWKSAAVLALFYTIYKLFLERDTFFQSIRAFLLVGIISSFLVPLIVISQYVQLDTVVSPKETVTGILVPQTTQTGMSLPDLLLWVYLAGVMFFGLRFLIQLASVLNLLYRHPKKREGRYWLLPTSKDLAPFSFFNYIVYPYKRFDDRELEQIMVHERTHADQWHSLDTLSAQLLCVFQWFNPFAWLFQIEMQKNLEYIADSSSAGCEDNRHAYEFLLLKTVSSRPSLALASPFYNSLIKKRIQMLQKTNSKKIMYLKFVFVIPALVAFVMTFNTKLIAQQSHTTHVKVQTDEETEVITKDFTEADLEKLKSQLLKQGIEMKYKKLRFNDANEITGIHLTVSNNKGTTASLARSGDGPIESIGISFDPSKGSLSLGNLETDKHINVFVHKEGDSMTETDIHKEVIIDKDGSKRVIVIKGDDENVWVSDSTKVKHVEVIEIDEDSEGSANVFIRKGGDEEEEVKVIVKSGGVHQSEHSKVMFIDSEGKDPLVLMDGKEVEHSKIKDLDSDKIETIEVLKGDKAVSKYGDKAKDGVIIITTKK